MAEQNLIVFDLEWNIGYQPYRFNYYGVEQALRGEIVQIGAVKIDGVGNVLDTFDGHFRPRIFRQLQRHIAKVTGLTQQDLDRGEPVAQGMRRFLKWCGEDAVFAEWGSDDVPVLKQNLFLLNLDESYPSKWYDLQKIFLRQHPRQEGEGMTLESVVTRLGIPTERPFHDALADALYTADVCRALDLATGLAQYPTDKEMLRDSLCGGEGDFHGFQVFNGYLDRDAYQVQPEVKYAPCPVCGTQLVQDEIWLKRGNNSYYTLCRCPQCEETETAASKGVFLRYKLMRADGLHWSFGRCTELPTEEQLAFWVKKSTQALKRLKERDAQ